MNERILLTCVRQLVVVTAVCTINVSRETWVLDGLNKTELNGRGLVGPSQILSAGRGLWRMMVR